MTKTSSISIYFMEPNSTDDSMLEHLCAKGNTRVPLIGLFQVIVWLNKHQSYYEKEPTYYPFISYTLLEKKLKTLIQDTEFRVLN